MPIVELEYALDDSILTQRRLHLRIGVHDVQQAMDFVAAKLKDEGAEVPGFRAGRGPLALYRQQYKKRIETEAFEELRREAVNQVLKQLPPKDQPFIPPEVLERAKIRLRYRRVLEFAVRFMVDPAGIGKNPEHPQFDPTLGLGRHSVQVASLPMGIPAGPTLPQIPPMAGSEPVLPSMPASPGVPTLISGAEGES